VWYDDAQRRGIDSDQWVEGMQNLGKISSAQDWWKYWALLGDPARLCDGINIRLFREDIRPSSDDDSNENGGKWTIHTARQGSQAAWTNLAVTLLGGRFKHASDLCGVVLSTRGPVVSVSVWNKSAVNSMSTSTSAEFSQIFSTPSPPTYVPHKVKAISMMGGRQPKGLKGGSLAAFKRINLGSGAPPGALVRNSVDGLAALKSGNLRASMDNSRLSKTIQERIQKQQAAVDAAAEPRDPEEEQQRQADMTKARRAFLNVSSDKFPSALMSPLISSSSRRVKTATALGKSLSTSAVDDIQPTNDIMSTNDQTSTTAVAPASPEWTSSDDEEEPMNDITSTPTIASSPSGNILARLPSQDLKTAKENWRKTATTIKPVRGDSMGSDLLPRPSEEVLAGKVESSEGSSGVSRRVTVTPARDPVTHVPTQETPLAESDKGSWLYVGVPVIVMAAVAVFMYQRRN